eukprot:COSAG01_NODE_82_length_27810_cov_36.968352_20_plen_113_part_00
MPLMPDTQLGKKDVRPRWAAGVAGSDTVVRVPGSAQRMRESVATADVVVMFSDGHVPELRPRNWRTTLLGKGSFGIVYQAQWWGHDVAVKEIALPQAGLPQQELKRQFAQGS